MVEHNLQAILPYHISRFLRSLAADDLHKGITAYLAAIHLMDASFNELTLKSTVLNAIQPYIKDDVKVINEPKVEFLNSHGKKTERRGDIHLILPDGRQALIEFKTIMPHEVVLPDFMAKEKFYPDRSTHFWSIDVKNQIFSQLANMKPAEAMNLVLKPQYHNKTGNKSKTIQGVIEHGTEQLQNFAEKFVMEQKRNELKNNVVEDGRKKNLPPPLKLFVVVSFWSKIVWILDVSSRNN